MLYHRQVYRCEFRAQVLMWYELSLFDALQQKFGVNIPSDALGEDNYYL